MYKISKQFSFSASHILEGLPQEHPCSRLHGHNYVVTVHLRSEHLNEVGFIKDYRELDNVKRYIDEKLDHRHLNDVLPLNPTAENMAKYLYDVFKKDIPELYAVEVSETPKTSAIYEVDSK
ncbi:6-pyruvoyltetrahydropterin/6-carboxytetrahydropterin synthase [Dysgonomonas sp. PFB1-18]|uniref:6-carboxytetrahydropterin synthase QueD n=1 Tax=unclassified Dysgonomonas TaxID=2630389 RepID=UPI002474C3AB|nr:MULTISPECIES: 6-carboxytetrahydropterin synthase QueD [unclassified Dysgonomonas]MDH6307200.1 6-pyruvoyltetrahydropterin/6-carboxytetrahydropterin synthase [Dysgonomonas sp. PF1-14]MDH6337119.1 6-pyruvoyltetrahydropterin/6-carboxytetrahydropterin synthase [Dysgonomonas sp. PF1-16]MDH6381105.1 6-pyruvoyltetrahydropterin/6-carboxytetrahydropterin synthase [Dysgonomonas sp. PFB1-18]MDH6396316.1 6-pyruvoyltetrahydropterin/6-carboxytetrahydropterin synthase [Dysgonomonas sp. PF1-23]